MPETFTSAHIPPKLKAMFPGQKAAENFQAVCAGLDAYGVRAGLDQPHRLVHFLAQNAHESQGFIHDREIWGPTAAQKRYEGRADLGNTQPGDGSRYRGRTGIMTTGRVNYRGFRDWCRGEGLNPPDFEANPEAILTDPWEGLSPVWYWVTRDLNRWADQNDIETLTKRINGGANGLADRMRWYVRIGLVLCGFAPDDVYGFQTWAKQRGVYTGDLDGDAGPKTRAAIHRHLAQGAAAPVTAAPVVQKEAVVPAGADRTGVARAAGAVAMAGPALSAFMPQGDHMKLVFIALGLVAVGVLLWRGERIAARVRAVVASFG